MEAVGRVRAWGARSALLALAATGAGAGLAGCGDDEGGDDVPSVSQEDYDAEAARLCQQHGAIITRGFVEVQPDSDAEEAAFYTTEFIPRTRAFVNTLADFGVPDDRREGYLDGLNRVLAALDELQADPFGYIDERHRQETPPEDDILNRIRAGLDDADIPC